jgi:uncharacterized protein (TIGR03435 family)
MPGKPDGRPGVLPNLTARQPDSACSRTAPIEIFCFKTAPLTGTLKTGLEYGAFTAHPSNGGTPLAGQPNPLDVESMTCYFLNMLLTFKHSEKISGRRSILIAAFFLVGIPTVPNASAQSPASPQSAGALVPTDRQDVIGTWQGSLKSANRELRVVFRIALEDNVLNAVMYSIDQGGQGTPASAITRNGPSIKIIVAAIRGNYEGKLSADGKTIAGTWTQGTPLLLNLAHASPETAWAIPEPPPTTTPMSAGANPVFDVATIKPSQYAGVSLKLSPSGLFESAGTTLGDLIKLAYDLHSRQIVGGPSWVQTEKYDVTGKPDKPGKPSLEQLKEMVRKLLADRFQLTFNWDSRELSVYAITIAKSGAKLIENDSDPNGLWGGAGVGPRSLGLKNITMTEFARVLMASIMDRPVVDQTGLGSVRYDLALKWTPVASPSQSGRAESPVDSDGAPPDLFTAFQEQLGLKLEATRAPVDVLVSDHVEKPSAN